MSIEKGLQMYEDLRYQGATKKAAKTAVYKAFPEESKIWTRTGEKGNSLAGQWGSRTRLIDQMLVEVTQLIDRQQPTLDLVEPESVERKDYDPANDMAGYVEFLNPEVGCEIIFNFHFLQWKYGKGSDGAYRQAFMYPEKSRLGKAGWRFEITNVSGKEYRVKVTARPEDRAQAAKNKEIDELRRTIASLSERLEALSNSNGNH